MRLFKLPKFDEQFCNLSLAKQLKKLEVEQKSIWWWHQTLDKKSFIIEGPDQHWKINSKSCSAFSVPELGMLISEHGDYELPDYSWEYQTWNAWHNFKLISQSKTEADARAELLIYILKNPNRK